MCCISASLDFLAPDLVPDLDSAPDLDSVPNLDSAPDLDSDSDPDSDSAPKAESDVTKGMFILSLKLFSCSILFSGHNTFPYSHERRSKTVYY